MQIELIRPGILTTVQDLGRTGWRRSGVPTSGAMDPDAHRTANLLVGNPQNAAALEMTMSGAVVHFSEDAIVSLTGAEMPAEVDGRAIPSYRPVGISRSSQLRIGFVTAGCRGYLAIAGGIESESVLGSRATFLPGRFGGVGGRPLRAGDRLPGGKVDPAVWDWLRKQTEASASGYGWRAMPREPLPTGQSEIRVCRGRHIDEFPAEVLQVFLNSEFTISTQSDRIGYRLTGPVLEHAAYQEHLSEATLPGTVQVPRDGQPIVLMVDAPVTGGYPKIAQVIAVDLPRLAQMRPGDRLRFREVSIPEAIDLYHERETYFAKLQLGLRWKGYWSP